LSYGRATAERGVLVNAQLDVDNLTEDAFVTKSLVCDNVGAVGGLQNIDCSNKKLLMAASSAKQKYLAYLDDEKKKKESSG